MNSWWIKLVVKSETCPHSDGDKCYPGSDAEDEAVECSERICPLKETRLHSIVKSHLGGKQKGVSE